MQVKDLLKNNKKIIWAIISILLVIGLNMSIYVVNSTITFDGNYIIYIFLSVFFYIVFKEANKYKEKRLKICSSMLSLIFAIFQVLGLVTKNNWITSEVIVTKEIVFFVIVKFITYFIIFYNIIKILFNIFDKREEKKERKDILKPNLKVFITVALLLFIFWLPYFLNYYPGITSYDTHYQLMQGLGKIPYNNHHPVLHTFIMTTIVKIGNAITGNYNFGIAIYSLLQMVFCAITLSFVIYYMGKKNINPIIKIFTFLAFAFIPFVPQLSIAVWKDIPFAMFMIWFLIGIIEMAENKEQFFSKKRNVIFFILITICVLFFRNNGVYIVILTLPFVLFFRRQYWKQILLMMGLPIVFYYIITGPVFNMLNIAKSSPREMLSIPIQQMARVVKYKEDELSKEEKDLIGQYIDIDVAKESYSPTISDPVKNTFNDGTFNQDKLNLIKLYIKLAIKYPGETLEALVGNTYGYYYPEIETYPIATSVYKSPFEQEQFMDLKQEPIIEIPMIDDMINAIYEKQIPIVSLIANIGFVFWCMLFLVFYNIYKKKYDKLIMFIPVVILYLTCLASPVSGEFRYIYPMFLSMPLFIGISTNIHAKKRVN